MAGNRLRLLGEKEDGFSDLEIALAIPVLSLLLIGVGDLGLALAEWIHVNSAAEAAALYVLRYANGDASQGYDNLYLNSPANIASSVQTAATQSYSGITANMVSLAVTTACSCPSAAGITCPTTSPGNFSSTPPKCPDTTTPCSDATYTTGGTRKSGYICVTATHTHNSLFGAAGWAPTLSANVVINIH
jgi:Flp pilus assembly protein TadG